MFFEKYKQLSHRQRALLDGKLITYHFYVGGLTMLFLGVWGMVSGEMFMVGAAFFGIVSIIMGGALQILHWSFSDGEHRDAYLALISAALGRYSFPLVPSLLTFIILFSLMICVIYMLSP